jgi:hypothetical protein
MSVARSLAASPARSAVPAAPAEGRARHARHPGASCTCLPPRSLPRRRRRSAPAGRRPAAFPGGRHRLPGAPVARWRRLTALPDRDCLLAPFRQPPPAVPYRQPGPGGPPRPRDVAVTGTGAGDGGSREHRATAAPGVPPPDVARLATGPGVPPPGVAARLTGTGARRPRLTTLTAGHGSRRPGPLPARCATASPPWLSAARQLRRRALPAGPLLRRRHRAPR